MRCDGRCGISSISVETKRMASDGLQTQTLDLSLVRQPLVGPDLPKKLCPFVSVEGDLPILDP